MSAKNLTVFVDQIGRTIIAEAVKETKTVLEAKNPAVVHVQPNPQTGQISVQLVPFFFKEFAKDQKDSSVWEFLKTNITRAKELKLDDRLTTQYNNMYSVIKTPGTGVLTPGGEEAAPSDTPVIKLFDD